MDVTSEVESQSFDVGFQHDIDRHVHTLQMCFLDFKGHGDFDSDFANSEVNFVDPMSMKIVQLLILNLSVENCNNLNVMYQHFKVEQCFYLVIFCAGRPCVSPHGFSFHKNRVEKKKIEEK